MGDFPISFIVSFVLLNAVTVTSFKAFELFPKEIVGTIVVSPSLTSTGSSTVLMPVNDTTSV